MLETTHNLAMVREKRVEEIEFEDAFGHDATDEPETYAGILKQLIEDAGGFENLDAAQLTLLEEQAREQAARLRKKAKEH